jgi:hypothetical protein
MSKFSPSFGGFFFAAKGLDKPYNIGYNAQTLHIKV